MIILSIHVGHDSSVCVLKDGVVLYFCENERLNHEKHTQIFSEAFLYALRNYIPDYVFVTHLGNELPNCPPPGGALEQIRLLIDHFSYHYWNNKEPVIYDSDEHHWYHASNAFYSSGFDEATVVVIDAGGKKANADLSEKESIFKYSYDEKPQLLFSGMNEIGSIWMELSISFFGEKGWYNSGKIMGASAYGKNDPTCPPAYLNNRANYNFLEYVKTKEMSLEDASFRLQNDSFDPLCSIIDHAIEMTNPTNICLSGGFFMNVVNNYKLLEKYPNINIWIDPICQDSGISIGCSKHYYYDITNSKTKHPLETIYLGNEANYDRDLKENESERKTTPLEVAQLLSNKNIVAIYQGRSEAGPRALGNRSLLYDPRDPNGRDVVNTIKRREYYRPFAGTVLEEHVHDWFDMSGIDNSPYMTYAVRTKQTTTNLAPALQHIDGTSRIQTVNKNQNKHYYELISAFYDITGIPMVLNTSFNLAGDTMVDNMADAMKTCREGKIPYLYCPERSMLIEFNH